MISTQASDALKYSVISTAVALAVFGYIKGRFTGAPPIRSSIQTTVIGGLAAGAAYSIAKLFSH
jgi:VIT1/CCC1 family predicted Fe2+/Mn2+ transporter